MNHYAAALISVTRTFIDACLVLFAMGVLSASAAPKTLLIGIDGVAFEKMLALNLPNIKSLTIQPTYTGGVAGMPTDQETSSGAGWATILTGVWANKHQIVINENILANKNYPSVFKRIREARPGAYISSFTSWPYITDSFFREDVRGNNITLSHLSDAAVVSNAVSVLRQQPADFTFVQLSDPDLVGHNKCFGADYDASLREADRQVGELRAAVSARHQPSEDWLILVTTDHGRETPNGCGHGGQTKEQKTTFIATNKPLNAEFSTRLTGLENMDFGGIYGTAAQTSIAPTILRHMGIALDRNASLDGNPLLGELSVRKPMLSNSPGHSIRWYGGGAGTVSLYRNNAMVAQVPASQGYWADPAGTTAGAEYTLILNNTPIALHGLNAVRAAVEWTYPQSFYFLYDGRYMRYNNINDAADFKYPQQANEARWPGVSAYVSKIIGGVSKDATVAYLFLNDGRYISYNKKLDRADSDNPKQINNSTWPGMAPYATNIRTVVRWSGDTLIFILKDSRYIFFNLRTDRIESGYPKPINNTTWPGVGNYAREIETMVKYNANTLFIFLSANRYIRYNLSNDSADAGYPQPVNDKTWPGLL